MLTVGIIFLLSARALVAVDPSLLGDVRSFAVPEGRVIPAEAFAC